MVIHVEFPTFLPFESETCRVSGIGRLVVDTSGELSCGNDRIIGAAVRSVRAVESLHVTVLTVNF